jgi:hypothetical protein
VMITALLDVGSCGYSQTCQCLVIIAAWLHLVMLHVGGWLHSTAANRDHFSGRWVNTISWCDTIRRIRFPHHTNTLWHAAYGVSQCGVSDNSPSLAYLLTHYNAGLCSLYLIHAPRYWLQKNRISSCPKSV